MWHSGLKCSQGAVLVAGFGRRANAELEWELWETGVSSLEGENSTRTEVT